MIELVRRLSRDTATVTAATGGSRRRRGRPRAQQLLVFNETRHQVHGVLFKNVVVAALAGGNHTGENGHHVEQHGCMDLRRNKERMYMENKKG